MVIVCGQVVVAGCMISECYLCTDIYGRGMCGYFAISSILGCKKCNYSWSVILEEFLVIRYIV